MDRIIAGQLFRRDTILIWSRDAVRCRKWEGYCSLYNENIMNNIFYIERNKGINIYKSLLWKKYDISSYFCDHLKVKAIS